MILIKENTEKRRKVYKDNDRYVKVWEDVSPKWIFKHVNVLRDVAPDLLESYGSNWISYYEVPGTVANTIPHTDEFIRDIYKFCLESIEQSKPYVHGDWVLSNIIIKPDNTFQLIDWDNCDVYPEDDYMDKLHRDLRSAFGDRFYDATGI